MEIFDNIFLTLPCPSCGEVHEIPLRNIDLSQALMHDGCPVSMPRDCPQLFWHDLLDPEALRQFVEAWRGLQASAAASGGALAVRADGSGGEQPGEP